MLGKLGSNKGKHTPHAKWTSIMRKLDNELEKEKQRAKESSSKK